MNITTEHISNWDNKVVSHKKNKYPQALDKNSPRMFFVSLFIGSRGSGKTFAIVKLLKQYENYGIVNTTTNKLTDQRIILFSPTIEANPIFKSLKYLGDDDNITDYSDNKLLEVIENIKHENEETKRYQEDLLLYKKFVKLSHMDSHKLIKAFTPEEHHRLEMMNYEEPTKPTYPNGVVNFIIFDDLLGTDAFKMVGRSALTNLVLKNRHLGINILIACQSLKSITKSIRNNTSLFVIYRFANKKIILDDLYPEVSGKLIPQQFIDLYDFATKEDHDALVIDLTGSDKSVMFRKNFDTALHFA